LNQEEIYILSEEGLGSTLSIYMHITVRDRRYTEYDSCDYYFLHRC
jgi:hypothetical protein